MSGGIGFYGILIVRHQGRMEGEVVVEAWGKEEAGWEEEEADGVEEVLGEGMVRLY